MIVSMNGGGGQALVPREAAQGNRRNQGLLLGTGLMRGPLGTHRLPEVLGKALAPDFFLRKASILVCP